MPTAESAFLFKCEKHFISSTASALLYRYHHIHQNMFTHTVSVSKLHITVFSKYATTLQSPDNLWLCTY